MKSKPAAAPVQARWFSENPDKAWGEKFFLIYTPIWILQTAMAVVFGYGKTMGDFGSIIYSLFVAGPFVVVPFLIYKEAKAGKPWYKTYWFKANLYIAIFSLLGNYYGSEYFFDVLGMVYNYPNLHWTFDASLVGAGVQHTPVMMYLLTHAYFMTYHTTAMVVLRRLRTSRLGQSSAWVFPVAIFVTAYFWSWMETFAMANPAMADTFYYKDLNRMLAIGSITYSCFFITSFPIFYWLDEKLNDTWGLIRTTAAALSASMLTFFLLDLWTKYIGPI